MRLRTGRHGTALLGTFLLSFPLLSSSSVRPAPQPAKKTTNQPSYAGFRKRLGSKERLPHALDRLTFGAQPGDVERIERLGLHKWIERELHPEREAENPLLEQRLAALTALNMSTAEAVEQFKKPANSNNGSVRPKRVIVEELDEAKLLRAIYGNHQLAELLDDFWFNHFNVFANKGQDRYLLPSYEREAIRPHIFGKFYDLLLATAESPAMLFYLDNWQSVGPQAPVRLGGKARRGLNENYGRELLELHTLGVDGGYTQSDVIAAARCFTGWTIRNPAQGGGFEYRDRLHDKGEKIILKHVIKAGGGMDDGLQVLAILASQPATAHHISYQLAQRFVADDPPPALVDRMAKTFLKTQGDLRQTVRAMVTAPEFWSQGAYQAKIKSPFEMAVSAVRATNADITSTAALARELQKLGEPLYRKIEPTGYANVNAPWVSSAALLERMNFSLALARDEVAGVKLNRAGWNVAAHENPSGLARSLLGRDPSDQTRTAIAQALMNTEPPQEPGHGVRPEPTQRASLIVGLTLGSPDFQRR